MSRRYASTLFFGAVCSSYIALCAVAFPANAAEPTSEEKAPKKELAKDVKLQNSDSWRGKTVFERPREEYEASGARLGSFVLKPTVNVSEMYDSNIYAAEDGKKGDMITRVAPAAILESDWANHALKLNASGDFAAFNNYSDENYSDYTFGASGRLDVLRETYVLGSASTAKLHEDRGSPDSNSNAKEPTEYTQNDASLTLMRNLSRYSMQLTGDYSGFDYENGSTNTGTTILNNNRDRDQYKVTARLGYEIIPEYQAFIKSSLNRRNYELPINQGNVNRDSKGYEVVVGTAVNLGGKTKGEVFAGYMEQDYEAASLSDAGAAQFGGNVLWNISGITSLKAGILRDVAETTIANSSNYIVTRYSLGLEHEIVYNILGGVDASYSLSDYDGISREDEIVGAGAELRYLVNRNASLVGRYDYSQRDSSVSGADYSRNQVSLGLKLAM